MNEQYIDSVISSIQQEFSSVTSLDTLEELRIKYMGRTGMLKNMQKDFGALPSEIKKQLGAKFNNFKNTIETCWKNAKERLEVKVTDVPLDLTLPQTYKLTLSNGATLESPNPNALMPYLKADYARVCKELKKLQQAYMEKCNELHKTEQELMHAHDVIDFMSPPKPEYVTK